jgi:hypothetical protein
MTGDRHDDYRRFVDRATRVAVDDGYLFDAPRCRFLPEAGDQLVAPPGAQLVRTAAGALVQLPGGASLPISGVDFEQLRAAFAQLPCSYSRLTIELGLQTTSFIEQAFSRVLFAPAAIAELEAELPSLEIVRFPGSPYEVVRAYWRNLCAVRRRLGERELPANGAELRALLLELHELLLVGEADANGRSSFYLPASLLGRKRPQPGTFYDAPTGLERRGAETILTSGARVSVPLLGGFNYWQLLAESVGDEGALADERSLQVAGLALGQVVSARSEDEAQSRPWFLPPRPLHDAHFEALLAELRAARQAELRRDVPAALAALGAFHWRFVRMHALPSGNQSLSMSFVNAALRRLLGLGIPHLLLDQLALRFELAAYQRLFGRAARAWSAPWPNAAERLRHLVRMRNELNDFVSAVANAGSLLEARALITSPRWGWGPTAASTEARALITTNTHGARLALVGDEAAGIG